MTAWVVILASSHLMLAILGMLLNLYETQLFKQNRDDSHVNMKRLLEGSDETRHGTALMGYPAHSRHLVHVSFRYCHCHSHTICRSRRWPDECIFQGSGSYTLEWGY